MKKLIYIMLSLCCLVFYSCGMTEPWKDWEHEGDMSADRLRPSEVKELLCAADGWTKISFPYPITNILPKSVRKIGNG